MLCSAFASEQVTLFPLRVGVLIEVRLFVAVRIVLLSVVIERAVSFVLVGMFINLLFRGGTVWILLL